MTISLSLMSVSSLQVGDSIYVAIGDCGSVWRPVEARPVGNPEHGYIVRVGNPVSPTITFIRNCEIPVRRVH